MNEGKNRQQEKKPNDNLQAENEIVMAVVEEDKKGRKLDWPCHNLYTPKEG